MTSHCDSSPPCDVHLLLRAHAQQHWLNHEVVPVLREVDEPYSLPREEHVAAIAYLEVIWIEAARRAFEAETACAALDSCAGSEEALHGTARCYHRAVRTLHDCIARHIAEVHFGLGDSFTRRPISGRQVSF